MRRLLPGSRGLWCRVVVLVWLLLVLGLLLGLLSRRACRKRQFAYRDEVEAAAQAVGAVLEQLQLRYFLCYGSLWGQLHERRNPSWEADAELCVLRELAADELEGSLVSQLELAGFAAQLDGRRGLYEVYREDGTPGLVQLIFFAPDVAKKVYRRDGWQHRALGDDCESAPELHCFPAWLVAAPLERRPFGLHQLPAPWQGFEIQKYMYPDSWFRDYGPAC